MQALISHDPLLGIKSMATIRLTFFRVADPMSKVYFQAKGTQSMSAGLQQQVQFLHRPRSPSNKMVAQNQEQQTQNS